MPPKGKKGKGGKKKSKAKGEVTRPSDKESTLQAEYVVSQSSFPSELPFRSFSLDKKVQELADLKVRFYKA